jgi:hypothetical protein
MERLAERRDAYLEARAPVQPLHERLEALRGRHRETQATAAESRETWRAALAANDGETTDDARAALNRAREAQETGTELLRLIGDLERDLLGAQRVAADARRQYLAAHARAAAHQQRQALQEATAKLMASAAAREFARAAAPVWDQVPADVLRRPSYSAGGPVIQPHAMTSDDRERYHRDVRATRLETLFGAVLDQIEATAQEVSTDTLEVLDMLPGESDHPRVTSPLARHADRHRSAA